MSTNPFTNDPQDPFPVRKEEMIAEPRYHKLRKKNTDATKDTWGAFWIVGGILAVGIMAWSFQKYEETQSNYRISLEIRDILAGTHLVLGIYWSVVVLYITAQFVHHKPNWGFRSLLAFNTGVVVDMVVRAQLLGASLGNFFG